MQNCQEILHGELERLFDVDELKQLAEALRNVDVADTPPQSLFGDTAQDTTQQRTASMMAHELVRHCIETDKVQALVETISVLKPNANLKQLERGARVFAEGFSDNEELSPLSIVGGLKILRKLGVGPTGYSYLAQSTTPTNSNSAAKSDDGTTRQVVLKVLRPALVRNRASFASFLAAYRLHGKLVREGTATGLYVGRDDTFDGGLYYAVSDYIDGQNLQTRVERGGPMHLNEARALLVGLLETLAQMHDEHLVHGNIKPSNLILTRDAQQGKPRLVLIDPAFDRIRAGRLSCYSSQGSMLLADPHAMSPEQIRGGCVDARSDVYGFGAVMFELLTGKGLFEHANAADNAAARLLTEPKSPLVVGPRGWIAREVADFVLSLLTKDPTGRHRNAREVLVAFEALMREEASTQAEHALISDEQVASLIDELVVSPTDDQAAAKLFEAAQQVRDATEIAEAFTIAADMIEDTAPDSLTIRKGLLGQAAQLYDKKLGKLEDAERVYAWMLELDPTDTIVDVSLENVRMKLEKYEEVVEMLLARIERTSDEALKAATMAEIGQLYATHINEPTQAVVAYAQAFIEAPEHSEYADQIDRIAKDNVTLMSEAVELLVVATQANVDNDERNIIYLRLAKWYEKPLARTDMALSCLQAVIAADPGNEAALEQMAAIFRAQQQYNELGQVLMRQAQTTSSHERKRDCTLEAAEILATRLEQPAKARELFEQVLVQAPGNARAIDALVQMYEKDEDFQAMATLLESRDKDDSDGQKRVDSLLRAARIYDEQLYDPTSATRCYERVVEIQPNNAPALDALDKIYANENKFQQLIATLERKLIIVETPRQKIVLLERIAALHEKEFLSHEAAAEALETILSIDPTNAKANARLVRNYRALKRWKDVARVYDDELKLQTDSSKRLAALLELAKVATEHLNDPARSAQAYEQALVIDPTHEGALKALAALRQQAGDAQAALEAMDALAEKANSPTDKADHYIRAAKLLTERDDIDGAIERYRLALLANPRAPGAASSLCELYLKRGDAASAIEVLKQQLQVEESAASKAQLCAKVAVLSRNHVKDMDQAQQAAKKALDYDKNQVQALAVLGDIAFDNGHPLEAQRCFEGVISKLDQLDTPWATTTLQRYILSCKRTEQSQKAVDACEKLLSFAPEDLASALVASEVLFTDGQPKRSMQVHQMLLDNFKDELSDSDKSAVLYRHGESARLADDEQTAIQSLTQSADIDPANPLPLKALAKVQEAKGNWHEAIRIRARRLELAHGDERVELLLDIGEIHLTKLDDRVQAAKSFTAALEERPNDRKLLTRLMQIYTESKDWSKLVEVVLKLADFVDEPTQKAKYIHTAAMVMTNELRDDEEATILFEKALELDPELEVAFKKLYDLHHMYEEYEEIEKMLRRKLERVTARDERDAVLKTFEQLAQLYAEHMNLLEDAVDAYEAAQMLDPDNAERNKLLGQLYVENPEHFAEKGIAVLRAQMVQSPNNQDAYRQLRHLYTKLKKADGAWNLCQALSVMGVAKQDELSFYERMRSNSPAYAEVPMTHDDWVRYVMHADEDPTMTSLLAVIEPAILAVHTQSLQNLGYDLNYAIDLINHPYPMSQTLYYASKLFGYNAPMTFQNMNDDGGVSFLHANPPSIVLGRAAFEVQVPPQAAAFIVGRHLSYYRPGVYTRHLIATGTGLKSWVFAAIKANSPQFPISADLVGPVEENQKALSEYLSAATRDQLASVVSKMLQSEEAVNLKNWVAGVDLTADRAGLIFSDDLQIAVGMIKASDESVSPISHEQRISELLLYATSEAYFSLRNKLGIALQFRT